MSNKGLLVLVFCFGVRLDKARVWEDRGCEWLCLSREEIAWFGGIFENLSCDRPASLHRWKWMGIRPAMPSIPSVGDVLKALVIHKAARCCSLLSSCI